MFSCRIDEKITLYPLESRHAEVLFEAIIQHRVYLREWLAWVDSYVSVDQTISYIQKRRVDAASNEGFDACIFYENQFAGCIGFHYIDWTLKKTTLGYWLIEPMQGKGIMTKACERLLKYGFDELGLHKIEIHCATGNERSIAIPERLGFVKEGMIRDAQKLNEHFVDHVIYGMLDHEWKQRKVQNF